MKRAALAALVLVGAGVLGTRIARSEDDTAIPDADLKALTERALAAAVTSSGKSTFALDDAAVQSEGGTKADKVIAALRAAAGKAKIIKHSDNLDAPMLHARFSTLVVSTSKESSIDHGLYLELEASNRSLIHANVTNLHKTGAGAKVAGHHTSQTLDSLADGFIAKWFKDPLPSNLTVVGKATTNSIAQQSLVERIIQRLIAGKAQVIAARVGAVDVERPKNVRLLGAQIGLLVALSNEADQLFVDGSNLVKGGTAYKYRFPDMSAGAGAGTAALHMKKLASHIEYMLRNDGYRVKPAGAKGKVWVLEARVEQGAGGADSLKNQLTTSARAPLVGHEMATWIIEAHDGETQLSDAKAAGIDVVIQPIFRAAKNNRKEVIIEVRTVADDTVIDEPKHGYAEEQPKEPGK